LKWNHQGRRASRKVKFLFGALVLKAISSSQRKYFEKETEILWDFRSGSQRKGNASEIQFLRWQSWIIESSVV
jgi:hypothetical protein